MRTRRFGPGAIGIALIALLGLAAGSLVINMKVLAAGSTPASSVNTSGSAGPPNTLTVVGAGSATTTADTATLDLGAAATAANVHAALAADNTSMQKLLTALHAQGVQDKDIQTTSVSVEQQTSSCCPAIVTGYTASNNVTVTVHHIQNIGSLIAAVVDAVGNNVSIGNVSLSVSDPGAVVSAARSAAMANANIRAKEWASLAHRPLGKILSVSETVTGQAQPNCGQGCGGGGSTPIEAGQTNLTVSVTVTFELPT